jgi:hypothetical protein
MGMLRQGDALAEEIGPVLGRGLGLAADSVRATSNLVANQASAALQQGHEEHEGHTIPAPGDPMEMYPKDDPEKKRVRGYPQDMWMPMDEMFANKPENYGLRKGWSGAMMGMMTMVRVLSEEVYDKIMDLKAAQSSQPVQKQESDANATHEHQH